jgi:tetratricopeptide (TPR) repeat protein
MQNPNLPPIDKSILGGSLGTPTSAVVAPVVESSSGEGFDWKKVVLIGGALVGVGLIGLYLFGGTKGEKKTQLKIAAAKFEEAVRKKEEFEIEEAEALLQEVLTTFRTYLNPNDENIAQCLCELSQCHLAAMVPEKALKYAQEALEIQQKATSPKDISVCVFLIQVTRCYMIMKQWDEAQTHIDRALKIFESTGGDDAAGMGMALRTKAALHLKQRQFGKAETFARQALVQFQRAAERELHLPDNVANRFRDTWECQTLLARICEKAGKHTEAEKIYKELLEGVKSALGEDDPNYAYGLRMLGDFHRKRGDLNKAEEFYQQSLDVILRKTGENSSNAFSFMNYLAHFYLEHTDQQEKAEAIFEKLRKATCLPTPTQSQFFQTRMFAFTFTRSLKNPMFIEPVYVGELIPTKKLKPEHYLEISFENPADPDNPIIEHKELTDEDKEMIVLMSPPVSGVKPRMYEIVITVWNDADKTKKLGAHHQMCQSAFDTDKIHTEEDLMRQLPQDSKFV